MKRPIVLLAVMASLLPSGASAQLAPGASGTSSEPVDATMDEYWSGISEMGRCMATSKRDKALIFLQTDVGSADEGKAFKQLFNKQSNACMRNFVRMSFPRSHLRGTLAEALYEKAGTNPGVPGPAASAAWPKGPPINAIARCYVEGHPVEAQRLLRETRLGTKGERATIEKMAPQIAPCFPEGLKATLNPSYFRLAIAEAMYHAAGATIERN
ncbi:hypothetical protein [Blastomonas sp.]|uniref:hypothetical protein n=1 Tax=Blastomonas sp. TaxID=1909299 RepID=UPI002616D166|nr:hypothetical protein [Blastomonas sp.]MDM7954889.1 hypothetical protein [Blastomonas sp.]